MSAPTESCPAEIALRDYAMDFPEATEEFPWGHRAIKVKRKVFVFLSTNDGRFSLSVKLPKSNAAALKRPFASPTEYGLGKSGWVTAAFGLKSEKSIPHDLLRAWIEESYRAVAPKKLAAALDEPERDSADVTEPITTVIRKTKRRSRARS